MSFQKTASLIINRMKEEMTTTDGDFISVRPDPIENASPPPIQWTLEVELRK